MPPLDWDELQFLEVLGAVPETDEYGTFFSYLTTARGLTLAFTVWPLESIAAVTLSQAGAEPPILSFAVAIRGAARKQGDRNGEFLRFADCVVMPERAAYLHLGEPEVPLRMDLLVYVQPRIMLRLDVHNG